MTLTTPFDRTALRGTLDEIIDSHGVFPVLRAVVARLLLRKAARPGLSLNDHLRRDIGLEPLPLSGSAVHSGVPPLQPLAGRGGGR